jgi:hypothetical protein
MLCKLVSEMKTPPMHAYILPMLWMEFYVVSLLDQEDETKLWIVDLFYKIKTAKSIAAKLAPMVTLVLPAELVVRNVGELVVYPVLLGLVLYTGVAMVTATPALPIVGAPVTRTASALEVPPTVVKMTCGTVTMVLMVVVM